MKMILKKKVSVDRVHTLCKKVRPTKMWIQPIQTVIGDRDENTVESKTK